MFENLPALAGTVIYFCLFWFCSLPAFGALQQGGYKGKKLRAWIKHKDNRYGSRLSMLSVAGLLSTCLFALCFSFLPATVGKWIAVLPFTFFCVAFVLLGKGALKVPLKRTERFARLSVLFCFLTAITAYLVLAVLDFCAELTKNSLVVRFAFLPFCLFPLLLPALLLLANGISYPIEERRNRRYVKKTCAYLSEVKAIKIGIVGSYGKTSVKNILRTLLAERFDVLSSEGSFNTPLGIAKTVENGKAKDAQVFIAEMGARHKGDVAELCELVQPDYAIFTGVCRQHIETFGSLEKVFEAKSEILEGTKKQVVCGKELEERISALSDDLKEKCLFIRPDDEIVALHEETTKTRFTLRLDGKETEVSVPLLGKHSAINVLLCARLALLLGMTVEEIGRGLGKLVQIPHRLELREENGVYVLDDGYNASEASASEAIAALKRFSGRKFVVTPGLVETGILEEELNGKFGGMLVGLDEVILVGDTLVQTVKSGYLSAGGAEENLHVFTTLKGAQSYLAENLTQGDAVLFLNDLPDVY